MRPSAIGAAWGRSSGECGASQSPPEACLPQSSTKHSGRCEADNGHCSCSRPCRALRCVHTWPASWLLCRCHQWLALQFRKQAACNSLHTVNHRFDHLRRLSMHSLWRSQGTQDRLQPAQAWVPLHCVSRGILVRLQAPANCRHDRLSQSSSMHAAGHGSLCLCICFWANSKLAKFKLCSLHTRGMKARIEQEHNRAQRLIAVVP